MHISFWIRVFIFSRYLSRRGLLSHMVVLFFFFFLRNLRSVEEFLFLQTLTNIYYLMMAFLTSVRWYLTVVLIYISLILSAAIHGVAKSRTRLSDWSDLIWSEYLVALGSFCVPFDHLWRNVHLRLLCLFCWLVYFLTLDCMSCLYISDINTL